MNAPKPKLDNDTTRERLAALGCSHAAEYLDQVLSDAVRQEIAPHAFLDILLETELSGREARRVKTSLRLSNLPTGQTWRTSTSPTRDLPLGRGRRTLSLFP